MHGRALLLAVAGCALVSLSLTTTTSGISYKFHGRELPSDPQLWSHQMVGHWLQHHKLSWHAHVASSLELSGADMLAKTEAGSLAAFFAQGGQTVSFDRGMGKQGIAIPKPPNTGDAAESDLQKIEIELLAFRHRCVSAPANACGANSTARRAARAARSIDWAGKDLRARARASMLGHFVGDALGMPTMWFYSPPRDVIAAFGETGVTGYAAPPELHQTNSLMADFWANNREHVREVVGSTILHGKEQLWQQRNVHYHAGLRAGENTLNAQLLRVLLRSVSGEDQDEVDTGGGYDPMKWLAAYADFMTTPGSHNDSYADTAHVQFFYRYSRGTKLEECGGDENHSTANIGAFYALVALLLAGAPEATAAYAHIGSAGGGGARSTLTAEERDADSEAKLGRELALVVQRHVALTHKSPKLLRYAGLVTTLILELLSGVPLRTAVASAAAELGITNIDQLAQVPPPVHTDGRPMLPEAFGDLPVVQKGFGLSCYVHDSLPAVLFLAYKYSEPDQTRAALLANTNVGGNTVHRGAILGAILGAAHGSRGSFGGDRASTDMLLEGLHQHRTIANEVDEFLDEVLPSSENSRGNVGSGDSKSEL